MVNYVHPMAGRTLLHVLNQALLPVASDEVILFCTRHVSVLGPRCNDLRVVGLTRLPTVSALLDASR